MTSTTQRGVRIPMVALAVLLLSPAPGRSQTAGMERRQAICGRNGVRYNRASGVRTSRPRLGRLGRMSLPPAPAAA